MFLHTKNSLKLLVLLGVTIGLGGLARYSSAQDSKRIGITRISPDELEARIQAAGWTVVSAPIHTNKDGYVSWIWAVTRGVSGGAVGLYQYNNATPAKSLVKLLSNKDDTAVTRDGRTVISVITTERPDEAKVLMRSMLHPKPQGSARPTHLSIGSVSTDLSYFTTSSTEALPNVMFGELNRSEVLHAALQSGWSLTATPEASSGDGYRAVSYTLVSKKHTAVMTLYGCLTADCTRQLTKVARSNKASVVRKGSTVLMVAVPENPGLARRLTAQINKAKR